VNPPSARVPGAGQTAKDVPGAAAGAPVTLAGVASGRMSLLGGVSAPLFGTAAFVTHGPARWVALAVAVLLTISVTIRQRGRALRPDQAKLALVILVALAALWGSMPGAPLLMTANLTAATVYTALMAPRPYAEIGVGTLAATYLVAQALVVDGDQLVQTVGVILSQIALGGLLLGIRLTTERNFEEHVRTIAAANARLEHLNRTDALTGLGNRRELDERLSDAWAQSLATDEPIGLLMIDIDHFKRYNDYYGHQAGDRCLRMVAVTVAAEARDTDIVARYGGEEFSVVLQGADLDVTRQTAERIRLGIARLQKEHATAPSGFVSVSIGIASTVASADGSITELIRQADLGLYEAKGAGRNRLGTALVI
jgi:diguanylate cyclase (GGDEF)-like protein